REIGTGLEPPRTGPPPVAACSGPDVGVKRMLGVVRPSSASTEGRARLREVGLVWPTRSIQLRSIARAPSVRMVKPLDGGTGEAGSPVPHPGATGAERAGRYANVLALRRPGYTIPRVAGTIRGRPDRPVPRAGVNSLPGRAGPPEGSIWAAARIGKKCT